MSAKSTVLKFIHDSIIAKLILIDEFLRKSPLDLTAFIAKLLNCLKSREYLLNANQGPLLFIVSINNTGSGRDLLVPSEVESYFKSGAIKERNALFIDFSGHEIVLNNSLGNLFYGLDEVSEESAFDPMHLFIFCKGNSIFFVFKGRVIREIPDVCSTTPVGQIKTAFPMAEHRILINKHYAEEIVGEKGLSYWESREKRMLISSPEEKFRKKLANFLTNNVSDGFVDEESLSANTPDRTDIRVITHSHQVYIIEIKWLGKSKGSEYCREKAHDRANEGIVQLTDYLTNEYRSICGILVIYDCRQPDDRSINWINKNSWDRRIDPEPYILYLDPENASTRASRIVADRKKSSS